MKLSISRDNSDLAPEQPSIDENIEKANRELKEYVDKLDREELPMWLTNLIIKIFKGGNIMDKLLLQIVKTIIEDTNVDDQLYKKIADEVKEQIPGEEFEPVLGMILEGLGKELQTPHK